MGFALCCWQREPARSGSQVVVEMESLGQAKIPRMGKPKVD
jgi:hypothetical protein